jgi:3-hydroxyacyl-[acyl-carrier-protein] dehydratase
VTFLFVDRILDFEEKKRIHAVKTVTRNEPFFYWLPTGERVLSPAVITEALAQAGSWLKILSTDFNKRPVLLADELTTYHGVAQVGDRLDLFVEVLDFDDDVVVTTSYAEVNGKKISHTRCCRGYLLPIEQFDDRENTVRMFKNLYRPESKLGKPVETQSFTHRLPANAGHRSFDTLQFIDGLIKHEPYKSVQGFKNFTLCESYFKDHFPYKPVVPGVMLLTFMGEVCQYLVKEDVYSPARSRALIPTFIQNVRFRKFVEPGDQVIMKAQIKKGDCRIDGEDILVRASMHANDNRVMQAEMGFRVMIGHQSKSLDFFSNDDQKHPHLIINEAS